MQPAAKKQRVAKKGKAVEITSDTYYEDLILEKAEAIKLKKEAAAKKKAALDKKAAVKTEKVTDTEKVNTKLVVNKNLSIANLKKVPTVPANISKNVKGLNAIAHKPVLKFNTVMSKVGSHLVEDKLNNIETVAKIRNESNVTNIVLPIPVKQNRAIINANSAVNFKNKENYSKGPAKRKMETQVERVPIKKNKTSENCIVNPQGMSLIKIGNQVFDINKLPVVLGNQNLSATNSMKFANNISQTM